MAIEGIRTAVMSFIALILGIGASLVTLVNPMKEELPLLMKDPTPTPMLIEQTRQLTPQEQATMSANFIKEFEMIVSSGSGERK